MFSSAGRIVDGIEEKRGRCGRTTSNQQVLCGRGCGWLASGGAGWWPVVVVARGPFQFPRAAVGDCVVGGLVTVSSHSVSIVWTYFVR